MVQKSYTQWYNFGSPADGGAKQKAEVVTLGMGFLKIFNDRKESLMPRLAGPERIRAHREFLKARELISKSGKKLKGYDVPDGETQRAPEELAGSRVSDSKAPLTALQRETLEIRLQHLEELLRFTKAYPGHPKSLGHTERDRQAAMATLQELITQTRQRLET